MELTFTARNVLIGATLLGALGGTLGTFALLRRQSLLGDALAHAALPGVCIAYLITGTKSPLPLFLGALIAGLLGSLLILATVRWSRIKEDSAIGIVLSVFFGIGIVLLTYIQKLPAGNQSGLDKFLFGQAATLVVEDLQVMAVLGAIVIAFVLIFYKEFKLLSFDREFGSSLGLPMRWMEVLLTLLLVVVVVVGLQTVGVVLIVAALITPAAAARQWTDRLGAMLLLSAGIGATAGAAGSLVSASMAKLPTGPVIVLVSSSVLIVSLLLAPQRGILWARLRERQVAERIRRENLLKDLYMLGERKADWQTALTWPHLMGVRGQTGRELARNARPLVAEGLAERDGDTLRLTDAGRGEAEQVVRKHRIWEVYLSRRLELPSDHVHRDAEAMEHALTEAAVTELEEALGFPTVDPHGSRIPPKRVAS
ncbi:MAG: manganese/zinc/iron transport system permease protein [Acidobacteriota bacterium]|jgi:manganese/zinc/iron transport system permease protein|nr:manganese/zinc/iron transport system permease protein [Acidobacteriota bacterium]